jgi:uncharacterized RDD family membrane protein YckC
MASEQETFAQWMMLLTLTALYLGPAGIAWLASRSDRGEPYGALVPRVGAKLIDLWATAMLASAFQLAWLRHAKAVPWIGPLTVVLGLAFQIAYVAFSLDRFQTTPGKFAFGLKVVAADGSRVTSGRAFARGLVEFVSGLFCLGYLVSCVIAKDDLERRSVQDRVCGTRVVYRRGR